MEKLERGMTEKEIIAILGVPPGDHTTRQAHCGYIFAGSFFVTFPRRPTIVRTWAFDSESIVVDFEEGKAVSIMRGHALPCPDPNPVYSPVFIPEEPGDRVPDSAINSGILVPNAAGEKRVDP